jgi:hypothetical protein
MDPSLGSHGSFLVPGRTGRLCLRLGASVDLKAPRSSSAFGLPVVGTAEDSRMFLHVEKMEKLLTGRVWMLPKTGNNRHWVKNSSECNPREYLQARFDPTHEN